MTVSCGTLQLGGYRVEGAAEIAADRSHDGDGGNGDKRGYQPIFDCRDTRLVLDQLGKKSALGSLSGRASGAPIQIGSALVRLASMASFGRWRRTSARKNTVQVGPTMIWIMRMSKSKRLGAGPRGIEPSRWTVSKTLMCSERLYAKAAGCRARRKIAAKSVITRKGPSGTPPKVMWSALSPKMTSVVTAPPNRTSMMVCSPLSIPKPI